MTLKKHSKRLSYILRHAPEQVGLTLDVGGWVAIEDLLHGLAEKGWGIDRDLLTDVVVSNDKKRFTISDDGTRIRAAQGHSIEIVSDLVPIEPPARLFHGTAIGALEAILREGLRPMSRQHVHLSLDTETAKKVGQRHGKPVILVIAAAEMFADSHMFYRADNGVWLTHSVPTDYLSRYSD